MKEIDLSNLVHDKVSLVESMHNSAMTKSFSDEAMDDIITSMYGPAMAHMYNLQRQKSDLIERSSEVLSYEIQARVDELIYKMDNHKELYPEYYL